MKARLRIAASGQAARASRLIRAEADRVVAAALAAVRATPG